MGCVQFTRLQICNYSIDVSISLKKFCNITETLLYVITYINWIGWWAWDRHTWLLISTDRHTYINWLISTDRHTWLYLTYINWQTYVITYINWIGWWAWDRHCHQSLPTQIPHQRWTNVPMWEGRPDNRSHNLWLRQIEGREGQTEGGGKQDGWLANQQTKPNKKTLQRVFKIY